MRKINIQKDVESREKISLSIPAIVSYDTVKETENTEHSNETVIETEDVQSEDVQEQEADPVPDKQDIPKKGGRKAKTDV